VNKNLKIYGSGPDVTIIDSSTAEGNPDYAILIAASREVTVSGFTVKSPKYGIQFQDNSKTVFTNNVVNAEYGIRPWTTAYYANIVVKNCTITGCAKDGISLTCSRWACTAKIYNNIITSNGENGIFISATNLSNYYNDVWNNGTNYANCSPGTGSISENPRFVDESAGNYRLQVVSPCIDKGWPIKTELDPDGTRNNMGAYGGPGAADFWPDSPGAPVVTDLLVTPSAVPADGTVTIRARGRVRPYSPGQE
jgi:hypothetical protein